MIIHKVTTAPTLEPVTVEDCRKHLGIGQAGDVSRDEIIALRIKTARLWCESYTQSYFMRQTITAYDDCFSSCCGNAYLDLRSPLVSVTSVKYIDSTGADINLSNSQYFVDTVSNRITPIYNGSWPVARQQPNSIRIEYLVGAAMVAEVDERIKEAIKFIVLQWERFQNVSAQDAVYPPDFPNVAKNLLSEFVDRRGIF